MTPSEPAGEREWIREALEAHERSLVAYATRITGDLDRARDVVQETFLKLCEEEHEGVRDRLREWLFTVCRNGALDVRRKESRMKPISEAENDLQRGREPAPGAELEQAETLSEVMKKIALLPENQQDVLVLKFRHGLPYKEISRVTGLSVSNVGYLIHMGIKDLRTRMAGDLLEGYAS